MHFAIQFEIRSDRVVMYRLPNPTQELIWYTFYSVTFKRLGKEQRHASHLHFYRALYAIDGVKDVTFGPATIYLTREAAVSIEDIQPSASKLIYEHFNTS